MGQIEFRGVIDEYEYLLEDRILGYFGSYLIYLVIEFWGKGVGGFWGGLVVCGWLVCVRCFGGRVCRRGRVEWGYGVV